MIRTALTLDYRAQQTPIAINIGNALTLVSHLTGGIHGFDVFPSESQSSDKCVRPIGTIQEDAVEWLEFVRLRNLWKEETRSLSSPTEIVSATPYLRIVGLGRTALPWILAQMKSEGEEPDYWFVALTAITGHDPISEDIYGDMPAMANTWFRWADENDAW